MAVGSSNDFDLVVLGAGTGGYTAAFRAGQLGLKVALVDDDKIGGTCLHRGCIPAKEFLETATVFRTVAGAREFGVQVEQPTVKRYYLVPSAATAAPGESAALDVLAQLMGSGSNSYLYRALVVDRPLAISAGAGYQGTSLDPSQFSISVSPKPGVEFSQVEQAIDGVIADVIKNPARAEDLERVKTQLIAEAIYAQDNQATLARWYGGALTTGLSIDDIRSWPDRIRAVTAEQVRDAAKKWLEKNRSVTGYLIKDATPKREEKRS